MLSFSKESGTRSTRKTKYKKSEKVKWKQQITKKTKYLLEFEGNGKIVEVIKSENDVFTKTGDGAIKYTFRDSKTNTIRTWTTSANSAISAITSVLMQDCTLMRIWSVGVGKDKRYYAEPLKGKGKGKGQSNSFQKRIIAFTAKDSNEKNIGRNTKKKKAGKNKR